MLEEAISMNERERILELVKKGVLSTDEALDLLEQIGKKNETIEKTPISVDEIDTENIELDEEDLFESKQTEDQKNLEEILNRLATESNQASAELDTVMVGIDGLNKALAEAREALMEINTKEELDSLTEEELDIRHNLEEEIKDFELALVDLKEEKAQLEGQLRNIRRSKWSQKKEELNQKIEIPEDWKEQASETINQVGGKVADVTSQMGKFFKKTIESVSQTVGENVEWKDINLKIPGVATTKFTKDFEFSDVAPTIIDVQVANGDIELRFWDQEDIRIETEIKLYGKMDAETPLAAFEERSQIVVDDEQIVFKVPNKRVRIDAIFYLPIRTYDYTTFKLLNGDVTIKELDTKDIYIKSTHGDIKIEGLKASMLEMSCVNGDITVTSGHILDAIIESVNGDVKVATNLENLSVNLVNGDIRLTLKEEALRRVKVTTVNGDVKVALPGTIGLEGIVKSNLGSIKNRLTDFEVVREKTERTNQLLHFRRVADKMAQVELSTTTGNIYLKNNEESV